MQTREPWHFPFSGQAGFMRAILILITSILSLNQQSLIFLKVCPYHARIRPTKTRTKPMVAKSKSTPTSTKVTTATPTIQKSTEADIKSVPLSNPAIPFENIETIDSHSNRRIITETQKINSKLTKNIISTKNPLTKSTETIVSASKGNLKNIAADLASKSIKCDKPPCKESKEVKMEKVNDVIIAHSSKQTSGETVANNNSTDKVMIPPAENSNYTLATDSGTTIEMVASKADGLVGPRQDTTQYINQTRHSATETVETGLKSNFTVQYTEVAVNGSVQISDKNLTKKPVPLNSSDVIQRENLIWEDKNSNRSATNGTQVQNLKKNATVSTNATAVKTNAEKTKFNYASFDCGAVVMASNEEAKHVTSILSNAKDAYMLNPCSAEKFVEIELCQDILISSIRLANFEYFSSILKNFEIFGSSKYPPTWISLGAFTGNYY